MNPRPAFNLLVMAVIVSALSIYSIGCGEKKKSKAIFLPPSAGSGMGTGTGTGAGTGTGTDTGTGTGTDPLPSADEWEQVASGTTQDLYGIGFGSATVGWAVGANETIICTKNGGDSWVDQFGNLESSVRPHHEASAHILGSRYTNPGPAHLLDVCAVDANTAWVTSFGPCRDLDLTPCFVTTSGGTTWTCVLTATNFQEWGIYAFDGQTARICTVGSPGHPDSDIIVINGGFDVGSLRVSWASLYDITFATRYDGWVVGGEIWHMADADSGWSRQQRPSGTGMLICVEAADANNVWACGDDGVIIHTTDGGATWTRQESGVSVMLWGIDFIDANTGWCVGADGTILGTTDGGATWTAQDSGVSHGLSSVSAVDAGHVWACGVAGMILRKK